VRRAAILGLLCALCAAAPASAGTLMTLTTTSKFVDPSKQPFNHPPCDAPDRPNALRVNVLLPDGYDGAKSKRWPVLYLLHGHGDSYDAWMAPCNGDLQNVAKGFPGIVVMPEGAQGWYADWWNDGKPGSPAWERYYLDELMPLITKRFKISSARSDHAIAGLSMGGEGAMYLAEQLPGYFGSVASFSGPLSIQRPEYANGGMDTQGQKFTDVFGPPDGFYATAHNPTANVVSLKNTRVFVTVGNGVGSPDEATNYFGAVAEADLHQQADDFANAATSGGLDVTYQPRDGIHAWKYWRQHLTAALQWGFFKPVAEAPTTWTEQTGSQFGNAWGFKWAFAQPPTELITFKRNGNNIAATGSGTVTITAPNGAKFTQALPFDRPIPAKPKAKKKKRKHHKRRRRA
jgi:S-formylglutathione hydrolase FrmB